MKMERRVAISGGQKCPRPFLAAEPTSQKKTEPVPMKNWGRERFVVIY
jgi:hypothetical protein